VPAKARPRLTVRQIEALEPGEIARDPTLPGFFAEGLSGGRASFKVQVEHRTGERTGNARKRRLIKTTLGRFPALTLDAARAEAHRLLAEVKSGKDPRAGTASAGTWTVARMRAAYVEDLRIREKSERTVEDLTKLFDRYLSDWLELPVASISKDMVRERHAAVTTNHGRYAANHALKALRTCFNFTIAKTSNLVEVNPCDAITFHRERPRKDKPGFVLPPVRSWLTRVRELKNPLRAAMHELGLFSGLRPGTLVALERAWLHLDDRAIVVPAPRMKARVEFALPLSAHMIELVKRAIAAGDVLFRSPQPYLFPTRDDAGKVIATTVWKEKKIPGETGHIVRHLYSAECHAAGVSSVNRQLLLGQKVPGIEGVYLSERALFVTLLAEQERVTAHLLAAIGSSGDAA
jgi:integrase